MFTIVVTFFNLLWVVTGISTTQPGEKSLDFMILEERILVNENVEISTVEDHVYIQMPKHNDLDAANVLYDYKSNLTLRVLPDKDKCYLTKNDPMTPPPPQFWINLNDGKFQDHVWDAKSIKKSNYTYVVTGAIDDRSSLSVRMQELCPTTLPMYWLDYENFWDDRDLIFVEINDLKKSKLKHRPKRQVSNPFMESCSPTDERHCCVRVDNHCQWIVYCDSVRDEVTTRVSPACKEHTYGTVRFCKPCCMNKEGGGDDKPWCGSPIITKDWIMNQ